MAVHGLEVELGVKSGSKMLATVLIWGGIKDDLHIAVGLFVVEGRLVLIVDGRLSTGVVGDIYRRGIE
ncbi:hypothetical protein IMZ48_00950 [Candidatus Bathyarchaeota archaeon]|nr:hypothetical protein [Candidatus Bathyarchaeota archaeon]